MKILNVLIACEESQAECIAFRKLGHNAFSCDLLECKKGGFPQYHIKGDVTELLKGAKDFITQDGIFHHVEKFDLLIAHPPCTYLCRVSAVHMFVNGEICKERYDNMIKARDFFFLCLNSSCADFIAVENPTPLKIAQLPPPSFYLQPSWFGVKYTKKTLYWTKNLPPIFSVIEYPNPKEYHRNSRGKYRSRTFAPVAEALATQWSEYIIKCKR